MNAKFLTIQNHYRAFRHYQASRKKIQLTTTPCIIYETYSKNLAPNKICDDFIEDCRSTDYPEFQSKASFLLIIVKKPRVKEDDLV